MNNFRNLRVWQDAHKIAVDVYRLTKKFPKDELFGLTSQVRRAVLSIPTNIVEGCGRSTNKDFIHFLIIARGSNQEVLYLLFFAWDLKLITGKEYQVIDKRLNDLCAGINALIRKIETLN